MTSVSTETLPFDDDLNYPQKQAVVINDTIYTVYYRWNPEDAGFVFLTIRRNLDSAIVCNTRIERLTPVTAKDPVTMIALFVIFPYVITSKKCEVWVIHD